MSAAIAREGYANHPQKSDVALGHPSDEVFNILFQATGEAMTKETMNEARAVISTETPDWPGALIVARGELDVQSVPELRARLAEALDAGNTRVVVDLAEVSFIDSLSLSALRRNWRSPRNQAARYRGLLSPRSPSCRFVMAVASSPAALPRLPPSARS